MTGNSATYGGAIYNNTGVVLIVNSTIAGNTAASVAGGIYNNILATSLTIHNSTLVRDSGGEIFGSPVILQNSIIDGTIAGQPAMAGSSNDLVGTGSGLTNGMNGNIVGLSDAQMLLSALGNYGGATQTIALLPGSPAIDAGSNALAVDAQNNALTVDQRGAGFSRTVNGTADIGASESGGFVIVATSGTPQSTVTSTAFASPLAVQVLANNAGEPVAGGVTKYTSPSSGPSAALGSNPITLNSSGAGDVTATANGTNGTYQISASASGISTPATFSLTNVGQPTISIGDVTVTAPFAGTATATFTVSLSNTFSQNVTLNYSTAN